MVNCQHDSTLFDTAIHGTPRYSTAWQMQGELNDVIMQEMEGWPHWAMLKLLEASDDVIYHVLRP